MLFLCSERDVFANFGKHLRGDAEALGFAALATKGTQERSEVLQGKMLNNAGTTLQQQLIAFEWVKGRHSLTHFSIDALDDFMGRRTDP